MTSLGMRFESERDRLGLTRAELQHATGYSAEQIRKVEKDLSEPGAGLLAGLMKVGGDLRYVLLDTDPAVGVRDIGGAPYAPNADEIEAARYRDRIRQEAREHARLKNDRRKRVLTDQEADLLDAFRDLSKADRDAVLAAISEGRFAHQSPSSGGVNITGRGHRVAGRDYIEGKKD